MFLFFLCGIFSHVLFDHAHFADVWSVTSHDILVFCGISLVNLLLNKSALLSNCIHNYLVDDKVIHRKPILKTCGFFSTINKRVRLILLAPIWARALSLRPGHVLY